MTGKKGRSGRAPTREAKAARAAAANKRWGKLPPNATATSFAGQPGEALVGELRTIAEHDLRLGRPLTWGDAQKRLALIEQGIINERREVELEAAQIDNDTKRGKLVERAELDRLAARARDVWWTEVQRIGPAVVALFADASAEIRARIKDAVASEAIAAAERVKKTLSA